MRASPFDTLFMLNEEASQEAACLYRLNAEYFAQSSVVQSPLPKEQDLHIPKTLLSG